MHTSKNSLPKKKARNMYYRYSMFFTEAFDKIEDSLNLQFPSFKKNITRAEKTIDNFINYYGLKSNTQYYKLISKTEQNLNSKIKNFDVAQKIFKNDLKNIPINSISNEFNSTFSKNSSKFNVSKKNFSKTENTFRDIKNKSEINNKTAENFNRALNQKYNIIHSYNSAPKTSYKFNFKDHNKNYLNSTKKNLFKFYLKCADDIKNLEELEKFGENTKRNDESTENSIKIAQNLYKNTFMKQLLIDENKINFNAIQNSIKKRKAKSKVKEKEKKRSNDNYNFDKLRNFKENYNFIMTGLEKNILDKQYLIRKLESYQEKNKNLNVFNSKKPKEIKNLNMAKEILLKKEKKKLFPKIM